MPDGTSRNLLTQVTDPSGRSLNFTWTDFGSAAQPAWRITQVRGPQYRVVYGYYTDPNDPNVLNDLYNLKSVTLDPTGVNRTTTYTYTSASGPDGTEYGLLASIIDPLGHTVSYQYTVGYYDMYQNFVPTPTGTIWVNQITEPGSGGDHIWTIAMGVEELYNDLYTEVWDNDYEGSPTAWQLNYRMTTDSHLRYLSSASSYVDNPIGYAVTYDSSNNVLSSTRVNSGYLNPPLGGGYAITPPGEWWPTVTDNYTYGPHGNVLTHTISGEPGVETTTYYDASKYFQKASVTDMNGHTTQMDYFDDQDPSPGNRGEVKWVEDARYGTTGKQFTYTYNQYGQKATEVNLNGVETDYTYGDQWGNLTEVVQDPGTGHLNRATNMVYDVAGHVIQSTDPMALTSNFSYNNLGQPLTATFPAKGTIPGETISYGYGLNGRTESVADNRGTTTMAYEPGNDRVSRVTDPVTGTISYTYGLAGERKTMTLPGGGIWTYIYNPWNPYYNIGYATETKDDPNTLAFTLEGIQDDQGREVDFGFAHHGELCQVMSNQVYDGNGSLVSYDEADYIPDGGIGNPSHGWLGEVTNTFWVLEGSPYPRWVSKTLSDNKYTYDTAGNRLTNQITLNGTTRTEQYGYDELNRLTSVDYGDGGTQAYSFDNMGNRLTKNDSVSGNESYTYNAANMLLTRGTNNYSNDPDGNTLTGGGRTNTWDSQNRLVTCAYNSNCSSYVYGSDGFRHRSTVNGTTTDFALDGQFFVQELRGGAQYATYLTGPTGPLYRRDATGETLRWYIYDGLGSVLGEVDASGNLDATRTYDVYGLARSVTGTPTSKHGWVGQLGHTSEDETGLVYMRARYMDPVVGMSLSEDPAKHGGNWFEYSGDNPVNVCDFTGRNPVIDWIINILGAAAWDYMKKIGGEQLFAWGLELQEAGAALTGRGSGELALGAGEGMAGDVEEGATNLPVGVPLEAEGATNDVCGVLTVLRGASMEWIGNAAMALGDRIDGLGD